MLKYSSGSFLVCLISLTLSGCAYDRSFMQMDSNSGVPFFGLQWAVDSGSRPLSQDDSSVLKLTAPESALNVPNPRVDRHKMDRTNPSAALVSVSRHSR